MIFRVVVFILGLFLVACSEQKQEQKVAGSDQASVVKQDSSGCKSVVSRKDIAR